MIDLSASESGSLYLGLISGTSADGIDVALASFDAKPRLHAARTITYPTKLRERILTLAQGDGRIALDELGSLDVEIARAFAHAALALIADSNIAVGSVRALGSHGQTVRHRPMAAIPYTMQLGDPNVIAELTGIAVTADFRRRDVAAGGHGAPLAPLFHLSMLERSTSARVILNLGGIANITILPCRDQHELKGFDTGPASCLMDAWAQLHLGTSYDVDGAFAASGKLDDELLAAMLSEPYFAAPPPKSTGREVFHLTWLQQYLRGSAVAPADVQATLLALSARSIAEAVRAHASLANELLVCGGGVHNPALMNALTTLLAPIRVVSTACYGIDPDFVEAMAFAWLARERIEGRASPNLPSVTGAHSARVLGGLYFGG